MFTSEHQCPQMIQLTGISCECRAKDKLKRIFLFEIDIENRSDFLIIHLNIAWVQYYQFGCKHYFWHSAIISELYVTKQPPYTTL